MSKHSFFNPLNKTILIKFNILIFIRNYEIIIFDIIKK